MRLSRHVYQCEWYLPKHHMALQQPVATFTAVWALSLLGLFVLLG